MFVVLRVYGLYVIDSMISIYSMVSCNNFINEGSEEI